ncbi:MAG TPA: MBL fold metallo-hydrolase [Coriobacteriia bacterium]|nr:MBL fold metallo-hydrolase [Coriobacteriia bacterium]
MRVEKVEVLISSGFTENCYILSESEYGKNVIICDPGAQASKILNVVGSRSVEKIILTHRHYDHIGALDGLKKTGAEVLAHGKDARVVSDGVDDDEGIDDAEMVVVDRTLEDGDTISLGGVELKVLHTPGHTIGSICLYDAADNSLIAGDTLFYRAVGRTDFPTGSFSQQRESLKKLAELPDETVVYPGHDNDTTIGQEKKFGVLQRYAR